MNAVLLAPAERFHLMPSLARELFDLVGDDPPDVGTAFWVAVIRVLVDIDEVRSPRPSLERLNPLCEAVPDPLFRWVTTWLASTVLLLEGDIPGALDASDRALELGTRGGQPDAAVFHISQRSYALMQAGRSDEVVDAMLAVVEGSPGWIPPRLAAAHLLATSGRAGEAWDLLDHLAGRLGEIPPDVHFISTLCTAAQAASLAGHRSVAAEAAEHLTPYRALVGNTGATVFGPVALARGAALRACGRLDEAEADLLAGLESAQSLGTPYAEAFGWLELARLRHEHGRPGAGALARSHAGEALRLAERHGYPHLRTSAQRILEMA